LVEKIIFPVTLDSITPAGRRSLADESLVDESLVDDRP